MKLKSVFSENINSKPLTEYPRPCMERQSYINLNGFWDYAITKDSTFPKHYDGTILVPFSPETDLSTVNRQLQPDEYLWYHRRIDDPRKNPEERVLLQFGAVDQFAKIYVNGKFVCKHNGGYLPFTADITDFLTKSDNSLVVLVQDKSDTSYHTRGKQKLKNGGMFYTAQSGIWQTVFMECVPQTYVRTIKATPNYDKSSIAIQLSVHHLDSKVQPKAHIVIHQEGHEVKASFDSDDTVTIPLPDFQPWSPEQPYLYQATITYGDDVLQTYFAMRKVEVKKDSKGILRIFLNNQVYFQTGLLDQGYWPESLYTPPSDEAMIYDIQTAKSLGFNMLRKHAKIEPDRWYYHCDRLGMLVWQDIVNGGSNYHPWFVTYFPTVFPKLAAKMKDNKYNLLSRASKAGREEYLSELKETVDALYHHPSIVIWVPFNEGWGQFDAVSVTDKLRQYDSTRLIDSTSGWFDQGCGDVRSLHIYFTPFKFKPTDRAVVLSEFGGYTLRVPEHTYSDGTYGYRHYKTKTELTNAIAKTYTNKLLPGIDQGLCATIYTQVSDIEEEINGIMTYDRKVLKVDAEIMKSLNEQLTSHS